MGDVIGTGGGCGKDTHLVDLTGSQIIAVVGVAADHVLSVGITFGQPVVIFSTGQEQFFSIGCVEVIVRHTVFFVSVSPPPDLTLKRQLRHRTLRYHY